MKQLVFATVAAASLTALAIFPASAQAPQSAASVDAAQLSMDAVPTLTEDSIRQVQDALRKKGFDVGPLDGIFGPRTEEAVRNFQDRYGMKVSGKFDNQTLYALGEAKLAGQPGSEPEPRR
ncbi:MAG: peptidoglycan-binding domain-containing protein [Xanthobacteraceae bacterium]